MFLLPVEGLTITEPWELGPITLHPGADLESLLGRPAEKLFNHKIAGPVYRLTFDEIAKSAVAQVNGSDIDAALDLVNVAIDLLRIFQKTKHNMSETTMFGLPGQIYRSKIQYLTAGEDGGMGWRYKGESLAFTFDSQSHAEWVNSRIFPALASFIGRSEGKADGPRRAILGVQLMSQAVLEHRPAFKMLNLIVGLESMLLERQTQSQGFRLARRASYFTCILATNSMCGRDRPTCQSLALNPDDNSSRRALVRLRALAEGDTRWRCSEWLNYLNWYDLRSSVAHGNDSLIDQEKASSAEYWILSWAMVPVLSWLMDHPDYPLESLDEAIAALPPVPGWQNPIPVLDTYDPDEYDFSS